MMAEWLSHVFLGFAVFTVASWGVSWLTERWIAVGVVGSILPDLSRIELVVSEDWVTAVTGIPFDWSGIHTLGGVVLMAGIGALLFDTRKQQVRAYALLLTGALVHVLIDIPQRYADGETLTNLYLFPVSSWRGVTPGWYVSADRWVVVIAGVVAVVVFVVDRVISDRRQP